MIDVGIRVYSGWVHAMAGYSKTPLVQKLGIKPGCSLLALEPPANLFDLMAPPPRDLEVVSESTRTKVDVILLFVTSSTTLRRRFAPAAKRLVQNGGLWVCWPKRSSGVQTDLTENVIRAIGLGEGLVDNKVCAVDATWSGLRFVIRLADRT